MADTLRIPDRIQRRFAALAKLPQDAFEAFVLVLRESGSTAFSSKKEAQQIASRVPGMSAADAFGYIEALMPLYFLQGSSGKQGKDISDIVLNTLSASSDAASKVTAKDAELLGSRLTKLLQIEGVEQKAKAVALAQESEHVLSEVRILSDVRPLFDDVDDGPTAAIVINTLKIEFFKDGEMRKMYLALDEEDLRRLSDTASRALKKNGRLKEALAKANIPQLDGKAD